MLEKGRISMNSTVKMVGPMQFVTGLLVILLCCSLAQPAYQKKIPAAGKAQKFAAANKLTKAEKAAGWKLLFDGKTTTGWRGFHQDKFPTEGWVIEDGAIKHLAGKGGGDIITTDQFGNFELQLEWKVAPGANSGIKYLVSEDLPKTGHAAISFEYQIIDDEKHPDATKGKSGNRSAGALYDLIAPQNKVLRPAGEYNQTRIIVQGNHVEHWLNGAKVLEFERHSDQLKALIAGSKFKDIQGFGQAEKGHILLQAHGDEVWFRNIKIRELAAGRQS